MNKCVELFVMDFLDLMFITFAETTHNQLNQTFNQRNLNLKELKAHANGITIHA